MLIYTYKKGLHHLHPSVTEEQNNRIIRKCIEVNKKFDSIKVYTTQESRFLFDDIVDDIVIVPENLNTFFQDDLKFYVLQNEPPGYTLIDGDIILHSELKFNLESDIEFEKLIRDNPNDDYFIKMRKILLEHGVESKFNYWSNLDHTFNLGIIRVNSNRFVKGFIQEYEKLKEFYISNIHSKHPEYISKFVIEMATCTYFLSLYLNVNNYKVSTLESNNFTHYSGYKQKLEFIAKYLTEVNSII